MGRKTNSSSLPRRNSLSSFDPTHLHLPSSMLPPFSTFPTTNGHDFELLPLDHVSYTSLKDLLPSPPAGTQSPPAATTHHNFHDISIRNRLVKQAAWAYLQPAIASSPDSPGRDFFRRIWARFTLCVRHVIPAVARALDRLLRALSIGWWRISRKL